MIKRINFPKKFVEQLRSGGKLDYATIVHNQIDKHLYTAYEMGLLTCDDLKKCHLKELSDLELRFNDLFCARSKGKAENFRKQYTKGSE